MFTDDEFNVARVWKIEQLFKATAADVMAISSRKFRRVNLTLFPSLLTANI
jgi:hypothetical protein